jgi:hypothetical protein
MGFFLDNPRINTLDNFGSSVSLAHLFAIVACVPTSNGSEKFHLLVKNIWKRLRKGGF